MTERRMAIYPLFAIAVAAVAVASLFLWIGGLMFFLIVAVAFVAETLVLRFTRREALRRSLPMEHWWEGLLLPLMVFLTAVSAALSVYDVLVLHVSVMQSFLTMMAGVILLMSGMLVAIQSLRAQPPHGLEKYGEEPREGMERGPYEVVRHPMMLAILLAGLSIPLFMGSAIGFIPAGLFAVAVIVRTAAEDDWRFNNYEWYYDYTKEVSYKLIPFIW